MLQLSLYGLTGPLPPRYTAALNSGCGLSGVVICVCRAISLVALPPSSNPKYRDPNLFSGALMYLCLAAFILVMSVVGILYMLRMPFTKYHLDRASSSTSAIDASEPGGDVRASPRGISTRRLFRKVYRYEQMRKAKTEAAKGHSDLVGMTFIEDQ